MCFFDAAISAIYHYVEITHINEDLITSMHSNSFALFIVASKICGTRSGNTLFSKKSTAGSK